MLVALTSLLCRRGHGSVRHQLTGAALQSAFNCVPVDFSNGGGFDGSLSSLHVSDCAAASTSSPAVPISHGVVSLYTAPNIFTFFGISVRYAGSAADSHTARRREILRDAAKKVSPSSTWLLAYSHNIEPRRLTYRLGKRSTLHALEEGWALYQQKFDTVAMAALLRRVRVAQLYDTDFDPVAAQRLLDSLEPRLRSITIRFGKLRNTIAYLHALAKLRSPSPKAPAGVAGLQESADAAGGDDKDAAATAGEAPGTAPVLGQSPDLVLDLAAWATRDRTQALHASPRRLATLLWALMRTVPQELYGSEKLQVILDRVALCSIRRWRTFSPADMRIYAVAFATFGPRDERPAPAEAEPIGSWGKNGRTRLGSSLSWPQPPRKKQAAGPAGGGGGEAAAASSRGSDGRLKRNALVLKVMADQLARRVGDLTVAQPEPRDLALAAHALKLQAAPKPHLPLMVKAADMAAAAPHALQPLELVLLVEALASYGVRHSVLMGAAQKQARRWAETSAAAAADGESGAAAKLQQSLQPQYLQQLRERLSKAFQLLGLKL